MVNPSYDHTDYADYTDYPDYPDYPEYPELCDRRTHRSHRDHRDYLSYDQPDYSDRMDRIDRMDRMDRMDRLDRMDRIDRIDRREHRDRSMFNSVESGGSHSGFSKKFPSQRMFMGSDSGVESYHEHPSYYSNNHAERLSMEHLPPSSHGYENEYSSYPLGKQANTDGEEIDMLLYDEIFLILWIEANH